MSATRSARTLSDRTLNRLIIAALLILAIGVPAMIAFYWFDRHVDAGPSLISREITAAEDAVRQNPNLLSARLALAYDYLAAQQYTDAVSQFNEALKADAGNKSALMGRGKAYFSSAQLDLALPDFQQVVDAAKGTDLETSDPQVEEALYYLGSIAVKQDRAADAVAALEQALSINRADADASYLLGVAYLATNKPDDAINALQWAVSFVPSGWCDPYSALVRAYTATQQPDGTQYATGMVAYCEGRLDDAATALQPITVSPTLGDKALLGLGLIAEARGAMDQAKGYYEQLLAKDPKNDNAIAGMNRIGAASVGSPEPSPAPSTSAATGGNS